MHIGLATKNSPFYFALYTDIQKTQSCVYESKDLMKPKHQFFMGGNFVVFQGLCNWHMDYMIGYHKTVKKWLVNP